MYNAFADPPGRVHGPDSGDLLKFLICARRRREDTQERYFYEWGNIHVALMLLNHTSMQVFRRYIQNYSVAGISSDELVFPLSGMEWDNMADHWLGSPQDLLEAVTGESYVQRMQPHAFGDKAFKLALTNGDVLFEADGFRSGGLKLAHWLKPKAGVSPEAFARSWRDYGRRFVERMPPAGLMKYVHNTPLSLDAATFQGTLFARGEVGEFAGVEEIWFESLEAMRAALADGVLKADLLAQAGGFVDPEGSFSMVTTERVVFDFVTESEMSPRPALLNPDSLEARVVAQGAHSWNVPKPMRP